MPNDAIYCENCGTKLDENNITDSIDNNEITIGNRILTNNWPVCGLIFRVTLYSYSPMTL